MIHTVYDGLTTMTSAELKVGTPIHLFRQIPILTRGWKKIVSISSDLFWLYSKNKLGKNGKFGNIVQFVGGPDWSTVYINSISIFFAMTIKIFHSSVTALLVNW